MTAPSTFAEIVLNRRYRRALKMPPRFLIFKIENSRPLLPSLGVRVRTCRERYPPFACAFVQAHIFDDEPRWTQDEDGEPFQGVFLARTKNRAGHAQVLGIVDILRIFW